MSSEFQYKLGIICTVNISLAQPALYTKRDGVYECGHQLDVRFTHLLLHQIPPVNPQLTKS